MLKFEYFPSNVYRDEHPEWVENTLRAVQKHFDFVKSESPLSQTCNIVDDLNLKFLKDYVADVANFILGDQGYDINKYNVYVSEMWGQEIKSNASTNLHVHKNSQLCGWFFLEAPNGGSYPVYQDSRILKQMVELDYFQDNELKNASSQVHFNNVIPGTFLFANSWLQHQLTINISDKKTKAIHFIINAKEK